MGTSLARTFLPGHSTSDPRPPTRDGRSGALGLRLKEAPSGALTLDGVLDDHVGALGIPAWRGAPIGHVERQLTVPIGLPVEMDASRGTIRLLEPAVI